MRVKEKNSFEFRGSFINQSSFFFKPVSHRWKLLWKKEQSKQLFASHWVTGGGCSFLLPPFTITQPQSLCCLGAPSFHSASVDCIDPLQKSEWSNHPLCHFSFQVMTQKQTMWVILGQGKAELLVLCGYLLYWSCAATESQAESNLRQSSSSPLLSTSVWLRQPQLVQNQSALRYGLPSWRWPILACKLFP